jgi:hypothetical protein
MKSLLTIALLLASMPAWGTGWTRTNVKTGSTSSTVTSVTSSAFTASLTNPSLLHLTCDTQQTTTINSPTDSTSGSITWIAVQAQTTLTSTSIKEFWALNTTTASSLTATCNLAANNASFFNVTVEEWTFTGATGFTIDSQNAASGTVNTNGQPTTSLTTTGTNDLILATLRANNSPPVGWAASTGFSLTISPQARAESEENASATSGSYSPGFTGAATGSVWVIQTVAFKATTSGGMAASGALTLMGCCQ